MKMIPLSSNIFHEELDSASRAVAALDVAMASMKRWLKSRTDIDGSEGLARLLEIKTTLTTLTPCVYDCRAELNAALEGTDTAPPTEAQPAEEPLYVIGGASVTGVYRDPKVAQEKAAKIPGAYVTTFVVDDPVPRN
jgi:hypothetical protein